MFSGGSKGNIGKKRVNASEFALVILFFSILSGQEDKKKTKLLYNQKTNKKKKLKI